MWPVVEERRDDTTGVVPHHPCIPEGDAATPAADHNALHPSPPHPRPFAVPPSATPKALCHKARGCAVPGATPGMGGMLATTTTWLCRRIERVV